MKTENDPFADIGMLSNVGTLPEMGPCLDDVEDEMAILPHLESDLRHDTAGIVRECRDMRGAENAKQIIGRIPGLMEAFHVVVSGRHALYDTLPALLDLAGSPIAELTVATLGFSKNNINDLAALIDAGQIGKVWLLCSHYFKSTSTAEYDLATTTFAARPQAHFLSVRNHAKLLCIRFTDGRTVTVESSANLRSNKNMEVMTFIGDPGLYAFHTGWVQSLFPRSEHAV